MKKYIFGAVLSLGILVSPAFTQAAGLTGSQIQAILNILSAFGADQSVINNVSIALNGSTQQQSSTQSTQQQSSTQAQQQSATTQTTSQSYGTTATSEGQACTFGKLYASQYADVGSNIASTPDGGYILGGSTNLRDKRQSYHDLLLMKLDANGKINWQKIYERGYTDFGRVDEWGNGEMKSALFHAIPSPDGGYLAATNIGNFRSPVDGTLQDASGADLLLVKTDASGTVQWQKSYGRQDGGKNYQYPLFLQRVSDGYIVAGQTWQDNGMNDVKDSFFSAFVLKVDDHGDIVWQKRLGTEEGAKFASLIHASDGGYFVVLGSSAAVENQGWPDPAIVLFKLDSSGSVQWTKTYASKLVSVDTMAVSSTADGGFVVTSSVYDYRPTSTNQRSQDIAFFKFDASGSVQWSRQYGTATSHESPRAIKQTSDGGYVVLGDDRDDILLFKLNEGGDIAWQKAYSSGPVWSSIGKEDPTDFMMTSDGGYAIVGKTNRSATPGNPFAGNTSDMLVFKVDVSGNIAFSESGWSVKNPNLELTTSIASLVAPLRGGIGVVDSFDLSNSSFSANASNATLIEKDLSQGTCGATTAVPSITVLSPNGGEQFAPGSKQYIKWSTQNFGSANVRINLQKNDIYLRNLFDSTVNDGIATWAVPSDLELASDYKIIIRKYDDLNSAYDKSDAPFSVVVGPLSILTSSLPQAAVGTPYSASISASGGIGSYAWRIVNGVLPPGLSTVTAECFRDPCQVPFSIAGTPTVAGTYSFSVSVSDGTVSSARQFAISVIAGTTTPSITVLSPNGGEQFAPGSTQYIKWNAQNLGASNVRINLQKNDVYLMNLFDSIPNDGIATWAVPSDLVPGNDYKIIIRKYDDLNSAYDKSDAPFSITASLSSNTYSNRNPGLASALGAFDDATNPVPQSTSSFSYVWNRDLQIGSPYPDDIAALQQALVREGVYAGEITGGFYNQTYTAVRAFQEKYGIPVTGYVGSLTRSKLNTLYSQ